MVTTFKVCPKCQGQNFVASRRCRHHPCDHAFLTGPRGERTANRRRSQAKSNPTPAAAALGPSPFPTSSSSSLPFPVSRPRGRPRKSAPTPPPAPLPLSSSTDLNQDVCAICHDTGKLLCCDECELAYHLDCASLLKVPRGHWACPHCQTEKAKVKREGEKAANGGEGEGSAGSGGGMAGVEGLDVSQRALWTALEADKGEDIEVDGLTFTLFPAPAAAPLRKKEEEAVDSSSHMQDEGMEV